MYILLLPGQVKHQYRIAPRLIYHWMKGKTQPRHMQMEQRTMQKGYEMVSSFLPRPRLILTDLEMMRSINVEEAGEQLQTRSCSCSSRQKWHNVCSECVSRARFL